MYPKTSNIVNMTLKLCLAIEKRVAYPRSQNTPNTKHLMHILSRQLGYILQCSLNFKIIHKKNPAHGSDNVTELWHRT